MAACHIATRLIAVVATNAVAGTLTTCMVTARTGATTKMAMAATNRTVAVVATHAVAVTTRMVNARTGATAAMAVYIATRGTGAVVATNAVAGTTARGAPSAT